MEKKEVSKTRILTQQKTKKEKIKIIFHIIQCVI